MVYYRRIEPEAYRMLQSLGRGEPIGRAIEHGFKASRLSPEQGQAAIGRWFAIWAELGWLCPPNV